MQNETIEERVALLELQVSDIREDLTTTEQEVEDLGNNVDFLFDEQVIQDERLLNLEVSTNEIEDEVESKKIRLRNFVNFVQYLKPPKINLFTKYFAHDISIYFLKID